MPGMAQQAFVIDQRACIGCHACTVACKVEHGVELGVFRTWVKYIERGEFPDTRRHFCGLALQSLHRCAVRRGVPGNCAVQARGWDRRLRSGAVHRLQGVPERVSLRRALHRSELAHGREVQLLRAPRRARPQAFLRGRLPGRGDHLRRHRRPRVGGQPAARHRPVGGARRRAGNRAERVLPRRGRRRARSARRGRGRSVSDHRGPARRSARSSPCCVATRRRSPRWMSTIRRRGGGGSRVTFSPRASPRAR